MKFIHTADVHLGVDPSAGSAYQKTRKREIWDTFEKIIDRCRQEEIDLLLIAGDLFHRQPLLRELREVNALFERLERTQVVLIAGNHDYVKEDSYYRTFPWTDCVHMILNPEPTALELPRIQTAVYGFSYYGRELLNNPVKDVRPRHLQPHEILLLHGGDEKHVPVKGRELEELGFDYVALGHLHRPAQLVKNRVAYCGAPEPTDPGDTGPHGYIRGELTKQGCRIEFVPIASREYIPLTVSVTKEMTGYDARTALEKEIERRGVRHMYEVQFTGFRSPETVFDLEAMDRFGNLVACADDTKPAYDLEKLRADNRDNLIGQLIEAFADAGEDSVEYRAMCEGVQALMETRKR